MQNEANAELSRKLQAENLKKELAAIAQRDHEWHLQAEARRAAQAQRDQEAAEAWTKKVDDSKTAFQTRLLQEEAAWAKGAKVKDLREHCGESRTRPELKPSCDELARRGLPE
jgi:hypothetical protein